MIKQSESTVRRYINNGLLSCRNIVLAETVKQKVNKPSKSQQLQRISFELLVNRTYEDHLDYTSNMNRVTLQVDLMIGKKNDKQTLLTLYEPQSKLQWESK